MSDVKGNKKNFYRYNSSKKTRENMGPLAGILMKKDMEKATACNAFDYQTAGIPGPSHQFQVEKSGARKT